MIILGIDPGTATTGYGVICTSKPKSQKQDKNEKPKVVDFGCIITHPTASAQKRLETIYDSITALIKKHKPDVISVEKLFFFKNLTTAMPVSQARGVILLAAAKNNVPLLEFTPLQVKMTVVGYGKADKKQVQHMTEQLLDVEGFDKKNNGRKKDDAFDALAIALCGFFTY